MPTGITTYLHIHIYYNSVPDSHRYSYDSHRNSLGTYQQMDKENMMYIHSRVEKSQEEGVTSFVVKWVDLKCTGDDHALCSKSD